MKTTYKVTVESEEQERIDSITGETAEERAVGALCFLPKSIHILATHAAKERDTTAKRFFFETLLIGLEKQGVITHEQHLEALRVPNYYGWKGRK